MSIRLNKLLAGRGLGARRKCDVLIQSGVVRVNGEIEREPGTMVEPERDRIEVRGRPLPGATATRYFVLHKPVGVISTLHDPEGRRTIRDLLPPGPRLFPVGRLDADTSGLLVLTSDGELAHRLMHPRYGVTKSYRVRVAQPPSPDQMRRLAAGVEFEPGVMSAPARAWIVDSTPGRAMLSLVIHEGRYRQVRRMCEAVGLTVLGLHRSAYGPLRLGELTRGMWRELSEAEVAGLRAAAARPARRGGAPGRYLGVPARGAGHAGERVRRERPAGTPRARPDARAERPGRGAGYAGEAMRSRGRAERPARGAARGGEALPSRGRAERPGRGAGRGAERPRAGTERPRAYVERPRRGAGRGGEAQRPHARAERTGRGAVHRERPAGMRSTRPDARARSSRTFDTRRGKPGRPTDSRRTRPDARVRSSRSFDTRRGKPGRPPDSRRGAFDGPGSARRGASDRPGNTRRRAPDRSGNARRGATERSGISRRGAARRPVDTRRGPPSASGSPRRGASRGVGRSGDMARGPGRDGAKSRSRRPARGPARRRSR